MFDFFVKENRLADLMDGFSDIHCHLLPSVDDGSPDDSHSIELLKKMNDLGVRRIYMTPHIINGLYESKTESELRQIFSEFKYDGPLEIRLAAEYFIDDRYGEHLSGEPLLMNGKYALSEFSMNSYSIQAFDSLFDATLAGLQIIIAHPERYAYLSADRDKKIEGLFFNGQYKFQLNLLSLTGFHGSVAKKSALKILDAGHYDFVGTDTHSSVYIKAIRDAKVPQKVFNRLERLKENNNILFD